MNSDTDPQQYRIFRRIWRQQPETALLLIGDPKQAIYAFRGADIFTYMRARSDVAAHYTLDTNWRSAPGMVSSVNRLFGRVDNPFMFRDIRSCRSNPRKCLTAFEVDGENQPAMNLWLMPGEALARRLPELYGPAVRGADSRLAHRRPTRHGAAVARRQRVRCRPRTLPCWCVTARSLLIRDALNALAIPSVYLSNRASVFETPEAQELLWVLQAVLTPERENTLRALTAMFG